MAEAEAHIVEKPHEEVQKQEPIKYRIRPRRSFDYSCKSREWELEIHLPGVNKSDVKLKFLNEGYILEARRGKAIYKLAERLPFEIDKDSIEANYNNGLLEIKGKITDPMAEAIEIKL